MVCSNRGPVMASSRGIWLLDHGFSLFGACICLCCSATCANSCTGASRLPIASVGVSFVLETLGVSFLGVGSLACSKFSPVPGPCRRQRVDVDSDLKSVRTAGKPTLGTRVRMDDAMEAMATD